MIVSILFWKVIFGAKKHVDWIWQKGWWKRGWSWIPYWFPVRRETFEFKIHDNGSLMKNHGDKPYWENFNRYYYNFAMVISKKRSWWDKWWTW